MTTEFDFADDSRRTVVYESLSGRFGELVVPDWYGEAVHWLRGGADDGLFGLYLYNLLHDRDDIETVVNIGTARGHSTVCLAKGLVDGVGAGTVHTIDVIDPYEPRDWHVAKQSPADPARGEMLTMVDLISRFHEPAEEPVSIEFHQGDSSSVLAELDLNDIDLVFHDGLHTYSTVLRDIQLTCEPGRAPIQVFDDCHLFSGFEFRLLDSGFFYGFDSVPLLRNVLRRVRSWALARSAYPGVTKAVREAFDSRTWNLLEVVVDEDHAPITALIDD